MIKQEGLPPVTISTGDYDRLAFVASFGLSFQQGHPAAAMLANELIRATVVTPRVIPPSVATMHSRLEFRDDVTWNVRCVTLVYPDEDDGEADRMSVLSPEGAALIGLSEGRSITWRTPKGWRSLTLLRVLYQPHGRFVEPWKELS
ncbi:GreA/GreB family elongation factor [Microvirga guangxiensis]|uniref:Regulator of nucleoside diphosphate kinase n=1 Tax=Microvirga guangxiensis TaxID=549386 RepID=A0A1G5H2R5_9HYPH|nr:GreA/GreB family elongation factor [Microvirga guangxiensis]SCY58024.1 regulator of nucleoside diphosphate kinase [Microvirga guangxiensis]